MSYLFWEDDVLQFENPDSKDGPNLRVTLRQAQRNYINFGACEMEMTDNVRKPTSGDIKDENWKPVWEKNNIL
ncbi:hypothetical protein SH2C18_45600 [Clostridium sediminicola]